MKRNAVANSQRQSSTRTHVHTARQQVFTRANKVENIGHSTCRRPSCGEATVASGKGAVTLNAAWRCCGVSQMLHDSSVTKRCTIQSSLTRTLALLAPWRPHNPEKILVIALLASSAADTYTSPAAQPSMSSHTTLQPH